MPDVCRAFVPQVRGVPPMAMLERCKRSEKFFQGQTPRYLNNPSKKTRRGEPMTVSLSSILNDTDVSRDTKGWERERERVGREGERDTERERGEREGWREREGGERGRVGERGERERDGERGMERERDGERGA